MDLYQRSRGETPAGIFAHSSRSAGQNIALLYRGLEKNLNISSKVKFKTAQFLQNEASGNGNASHVACFCRDRSSAHLLPRASARQEHPQVLPRGRAPLLRQAPSGRAGPSRGSPRLTDAAMPAASPWHTRSSSPSAATVPGAHGPLLGGRRNSILLVSRGYKVMYSSGQ